MKPFWRRYVDDRAFLFYATGAAFAASAVSAMLLEPFRPYSDSSSFWFVQITPPLLSCLGIYLLIRALLVPIGTVIGRDYRPDGKLSPPKFFDPHVIQPSNFHDDIIGSVYRLEIEMSGGKRFWLDVSQKSYNDHPVGSTYPKRRRWL